MLSPTSLLRRVKKPAKNITRALQFISAGQTEAETYVTVPGAGLLVARVNTDGWRMRTVFLVFLQFALGLTHESVSGPEQNKADRVVYTLRSASASFAALDALKLVCCAVLIYYETRKNGRSVWSASPLGSAEVEAQPLREEEIRRNDSVDFISYGPTIGSKPLLVGTSRSNITIGLLALLLVTNSYLTIYITNSGLADSLSVHLASTFVPLLSAVLLRLFTAWTTSSQQWLGVLLQTLGLLSVGSQSASSNISVPSIILLIALALLTSLTYVTVYHVYKLHDISIPNKLNSRLFAFGLVVHTVILMLSNIFILTPTVLVTSRSSLHNFVALALRVSVDIASLNLIFNCDAVLLGVSTSLSTTLLVAYLRTFYNSPSVTEVCSLAIALLGFYTYWVGEVQRPNSASSPFDPEKKSQPSHWLFSTVLLTTLGTVIFLGSNKLAVRISDAQFHELAPWDTVSHPQSLDYNVFADLIYIPPPSTPPPGPICTRVPLPSEQYFAGNRTYHEFDDVLLIVFFSHARYDVNLDYYKEVYAEFFPNMVFVGPKSREDKGFEHSYDVFVDSYESEEDIGDWNNYKMAGRMAHHMLYTVLTTQPYSTNCYKGFLWAPFDTLLNVPRLQFFDQSRLWYFSPWGEYVPNPAVRADTWMDASNHAPPARVSPDPETDFEKTHRGWWIDWWWGDPQYGIPVCKSAFERVPLELRERMAYRFTNNANRYVGGSADTLYVPARLADEFVDVLGTFLNTSCFLEIAVPTVVHLIVPEEEEILFIDHWWIWNPPFNASFVRDRWERGMEVDTFHTFHWGDKGSDGVWRASPENIEDVRELFRESAARQGIRWLSPTVETSTSWKRDNKITEDI